MSLLLTSSCLPAVLTLQACPAPRSMLWLTARGLPEQELCLRTTAASCSRAGPQVPGSVLQVGAGWLLQEADTLVPEDITFECVSETQPTAQQLEDLKFAWRCVKHVKSNAITVAKNSKLLGMGSGQPNRVNSVRIALEKVRAPTCRAILGSEAGLTLQYIVDTSAVCLSTAYRLDCVESRTCMCTAG